MKQTYEMPQIEVVELELEGVIAQSFNGDSFPALPDFGE